MGSGKSTQALQVHHNMTARGLSCVLFTQLDRQEGTVSSRLGVSAPARHLGPGTDIYRILAMEHRTPLGVDAVICDEAQFYTDTQVDQLARVVDELDIEVYAYGLLTSFQGELFPGSKRFLELADIRVELQVEARCWCGERATQNARMVDGRQVYDGELKVVGDTDAGPKSVVTYDLLCRKHWMAGKTHAQQDPLFD
jgi:thymidine kinase